MNPEVKQKWVAALRSGEYEQTGHCLRDNNQFCCLGVLCDVFIKETGGARWKDVQIGYEFVSSTEDEGESEEGSLLPYVVYEWAGLDGGNPVMGEHSATSYNDELGKTFPEIADLIEQHL
jgi:hypothetical protein